MAYDAFLKLDGIRGESNDKAHKGEIEISSYSWGVANSGSFSHGGGGGEGKATFQDLHFGMTMSKASPKLMSACATGKHIPSAVLTCRKAGGTQTEFLKIKLADVLVSSYQNGGNKVVPMPTSSRRTSSASSSPRSTSLLHRRSHRRDERSRVRHKSEHGRLIDGLSVLALWRSGELPLPSLKAASTARVTGTTRFLPSRLAV